MKKPNIEPIARLYVFLIRIGKKTFKDVPNYFGLKEVVKEMLIQIGLEDKIPEDER